MAFTGGDAKRPRGGRPRHNGHHGRAQGHQAFVCLPLKIHHVVNCFSHRGVEGGHGQHPGKVHDRRH
ncbi:hypothetical protein SDC9_104872 [bioreactor metagenome]|uniref:Uncharacterized protein n=1 Tax=bioreactor metagenome TaxID=1076179 RepID=A0A645B4E9_9ZZZZ